MIIRGKPCDFDCFHCKLRDCVRTGAEILSKEAELQAASGNKGQRIWNRSVKSQQEVKPRKEVLRTHLGEKIREERLRAGLRCKDVAQYCGVGKNTPSKWETSEKPSKQNWAKLVELFPALKEVEQN